MNATFTRNVFRVSALFCSVLSTAAVSASDARTSATASGGPAGPGTAAATASFAGERGFTRTQTRTGDVNHARAVAVGIDEDGLLHAFRGATAGPGVVPMRTRAAG